MTRKLWCIIEGLYDASKVQVNDNDNVEDLKKAIKAKFSFTFRNVEAGSIKIWRINKSSHEARQLTLASFEGEEPPPPTISVEKYWADVTADVDVFIASPSPGIECQTRRRSPSSDPEQTKRRKIVPENDGASIIARWRSKHIQAGLPTIDELASFADRPLSDDEKIPIPANVFHELVSSSMDEHDVCTPNDVQRLFRVGHGNTDIVTPLIVIFCIVTSGPPHGGTDQLFHHFWDQNVRAVVECLVPTGQSIRNSSECTVTTYRPDYAFLVNKLCPFRGEEEAPDSTANPKQGLADKLAWAYDPAPYVLGYYATGPSLTLVAISRPPQGQNHPVVRDIVSADLRLKSDRIKNICRLINLTGLFGPLANLVRPPDAEFVQLEREYGTVEIIGHSVLKSYTGADRFMRLRHLQSIYAQLKKRQVPHVDLLEDHFDASAVLSPRGLAEIPTSEEELLSAIICVLEALKVLHEEPSILHRDIRWPNVMRRFEDRLKWFIVDWEHAVVGPASAKTEPQFNRSTHSPHVFVEGHGTEVDIWGVGGLIIDCEALNISSQLQDLGKWMQGSRAPSAQEALDKIKEYSSSL